VSSIPCTYHKAEKPTTFLNSASYLLAGGTGGLGRSIAAWMAERGAHYFTFISPHAGISESSKELFEELRSMDCSVQSVADDVASQTDFAKALAKSTYPIKGVFQLSMILSVSGR
jgi:NAD(P)-dependent dehydrogenase (short-subunit alcohol dehydrogenase family)